MAKKQSVVLVGKDPGGFNGVLPIYQYLLTQKEKCNPTLVVNGKATEIAKKKKTWGEIDEYVEAIPEDTDRILSEYTPDKIVTCMSSKGGLGRDLVSRARGKGILTFAAQDYWGTRLLEKDSWADTRPDFMLVNDEIQAQIILDAWSDFSRDRIKITGFPALDRYAHIDKAGMKQKAKTGLEICEEWPVILFAGQLWQSGNTLVKLIEAIKSLKQPVTLIARKHPRMQDDAVEESLVFDQALDPSDFPGRIITGEAKGFSIEEMIAVSDLITSMFSTTLLEAIAMRKQNIAILYPGFGQKLFNEEMNGLINTPPFVSMGATRGVKNDEELIQALESSYKHELGLLTAQEEHFPILGDNARKAGVQILNL